MKKITLTILILFLLTLHSCTTKKQIVYVQDIDAYTNKPLTYAAVKIQPKDILKIDVIDLNPVVAAPFNISSGSSPAQSIEMIKLNGYLVTPEGNVMMPILNEVKVSGLTITEAETKIKERLINENYLVNPTVKVRVVNNKFTILGEVNSPGVKSFTDESINLLDAIGMAGDLTYSGVRKDVTLIRELEGKRLVYHIDLTSASWLSNQDYQIRQNDVIYVKPNTLKVKSGGLTSNPLQVLGVAISVLTIILLIAR